MASNLDAMREKLHTKIDNSINQLNSAKDHLQGLGKEAESTIQVKVSEVKDAVETKKSQIVGAAKSLEELAEAKKTETKEMVAEWKSTRNQKKLEKRAVRAEKYAEICVELALFSASEAEQALLDAVAARIDVEEAK